MGFISFPTGTGKAPEPEEKYSVLKWCQTVGMSYEALIEIPEIDMRTLMTMHASSDFLYEWMSEQPDDFDEFAADKNAMKWIGLRDYICDKLMSIESVSEKMLGGDFWEYILKDKVPTMTSNTAPYGECGGSGRYDSSLDYYKAFDGDGSTLWLSNSSGTQSLGRVFYRFVSPTSVMRFTHSSNFQGKCEYAVQYSDDGTNWTTVRTYIVNGNGSYSYEVEDMGAHLYWGVMHVKNYEISDYARATELQFYGRTDTHDYSEHTERLYLYDHGVEFEDVTGGWESIGAASSAAQRYPAPVIKDENSVTFGWSSQNTETTDFMQSAYVTKNKISMSGRSRYIVHFVSAYFKNTSAEAEYYASSSISISDDISTSSGNITAYVGNCKRGADEIIQDVNIILDVSGVQALKDVGIHTRNFSNTKTPSTLLSWTKVTFDEIYLE